MPKIYGSLPATPRLKSRADFNTALRTNDQKMLFGFEDDENSYGTGMGYVDVIGGVMTNRFQGYSDYLAAGTKKVWASARAIELISSVVLSTETKLIYRDIKKAKVTPKPDPKLVTLLQNPNPYDTISEMMALWVAHMKFTGNCFWLKDQMNGYGQPKEIYCLNPRFIRIVPDKDLRVARYSYRINGHEINFDPEEIIHFKKPHGNDPVWGLGDIESGESLFDDHINRTLYNTRLMANGAMPSSVLVNESYDGSQDDWEKSQRSFNEKYAGVKNSGKVAWMTGKWSNLRLGLDSQAMQELEKADKNVENIFLHHGVPLSVAGYGVRNFAIARQEDISFRRYTCLPLLNLFTDAMNSDRGFIDAFNPELRLDFALAGLVDVEQIGKDYAPIFDRGGMTSNDMRELVGLPRKDDPLLDQYFVLNTYVPIEIAGAAAPSDAQFAAGAAQSVIKPRPVEADDGEPTKPAKPAKPKPGAKPSGTATEVNTADGDGTAAPAKPAKR